MAIFQYLIKIFDITILTKDKKVLNGSRHLKSSNNLP